MSASPNPTPESGAVTIRMIEPPQVFDLIQTLDDGPDALDRCIAAIWQHWQASLMHVLAMGLVLGHAKEIAPAGQWGAFIEQLPFGERTAQRLMAIARDRRLLDAAPSGRLPNEWTTLYELTKLDDPQYRRLMDGGVITPDMRRADIAIALRPSFTARAVASGLRRLDLPDGKWPVIYADPPYRFETYSPRGKSRSPDMSYSTMSESELTALPVDALAHSDCCLLLWAPWAHTPLAMRLIEAWGFEFKTLAFLWVKTKTDGTLRGAGLGYWSRSGAEGCWLATKGRPARIAKNVHQVVLAPPREHSRKPDAVYDRIERLVEGPWLELFGRNGTRPGWTAWGDEVGKFAAAADRGSESDA